MTRRTILSGAWFGLKGGSVLGGLYGVLLLLLNVGIALGTGFISGSEVPSVVAVLLVFLLGAVYGGGAGLVVGALIGWILARVAEPALPVAKKAIVAVMVLTALAGPVLGSAVGGEGGIEAVGLFSLPTLVAAAYAYYVAPRIKAAGSRKQAARNVG